MVEQNNGARALCGHRLKVQGGALGMAAHAQTSHGLTEEKAKRAAVEKIARLEHFFPVAPVLSLEQKEALNVKLATALCNDGRPLSIFDAKTTDADDDRAAHDGNERFGLHAWLQLLHPGYTLPSRMTLRGIVMDTLVPSIKADIIAILRVCDFVSFTSDGWKNTSQNTHYRDLSGHGIVRVNGSYQLVSFLLGLKPQVAKDANSVSRWIRDLIESYEIPKSKCGVLTADGAEEAAAREAGLEYWWCICHWINLAVHDAINNSDFIPGVIESARAFVTSVRSSSAYQAELNRAAGARVTLQQDVETRWSSEWVLIGSILKNLSAVRVLFERFPELRIAEADLAILKDVKSLLQPAHELTTYLESQTKVWLFQIRLVHSLLYFLAQVTCIDAWKLAWACVSCVRQIQVTAPAALVFKEELVTSWKRRALKNFEKSAAARMTFFLSPSLWSASCEESNGPSPRMVFAAQRFYEVSWARSSCPLTNPIAGQ